MVKQPQMGVIYKLTNKINGKYYFGKSVDFKKRMYSHKLDWKYAKKKTYLMNAIKKHGWENFQVEILINTPEQNLNVLETFYIDIFDATNPKKGYNLTKGGEGLSGYIHSDETKKKICMAKKKHSAEKGSICFDKRKKKWQVTSASPLYQRLGLYFTKENALKALNFFNETGKKMESDVVRRRKGTGTIRLTKFNRYQLRYKRKHIGCFKTKELAEAALKNYIITQ